MENQEQPQVQPLETESKKFNITKLILITLVVILFIGNAVTLYFLYNKMQKVEKDTNIPVVTEDVEKEVVEEEPLNLAEGEILVDWSNEPFATVSIEDFFGTDKLALQKEKQPNSNFSDTSVEIVGTITEGEYKGSLLYSILIQSMGIDQNFAIKNGNNIFAINKSNLCDYSDFKFLCINNENIIIKNLETPDTIEIPNSELTLVKKPYQYYEKIDALDNLKTLFEYSPSKFIYQSKDPKSKTLKYLAVASDNTIRMYQLDLGFFGTEGKDTEYFGQTAITFDITWVNRTKNTESYLQDIMGTHSGSQSYAYYINSKDDLKIAGYINDQPIYELKNLNTKIVGSTKTILEEMYDSYYIPNNEKISFEEFLTHHPIIFWEDPFGNFLEFRNGDFMPAAEMGKPVIYLYPESTTDVSVKVYPNKGLTVTEPLYKNGWLVRANPNGNLYNYDDHQTYPYLFWEGLGINYSMPQNGFVVAKNDIEDFLVHSLSQQGLIAEEYDEFIDFWAPLMKEKPYYFITFVPQYIYEELAPLEINPTPNTIIRVFMDYKGLDNPINVAPQIFNTPIRNGFTVVEWGGMLH